MLPSAQSIKPHRFPGAGIKDEKQEEIFFPVHREVRAFHACYAVKYQCHIIKNKGEMRAG